MLLSLVMDYRQMIVYTREIYKQMTTTNVVVFGQSLQTTHTNDYHWCWCLWSFITDNTQMTTTGVGVFGHSLQTTNTQMTTINVCVFDHSLQTTHTHTHTHK